MKLNGMKDWSSKSILLAEDEESNYQLIYEILLPTGVKLTRVMNGKEAIKSVESNEPFDLILLDIKMPIMDGIKTVTHLRQKDKETPIIAQTVFGMPEVREKGGKAGFNEFIIKPIIPSEFISRLAVYLGD
jgi:two-component system cell cycle response regulator DivK